MIEFELKPTFATVDSCFDLVRSHQYGIASYGVFSWSTDIHTLTEMVMTSDETQIQILANWPMLHAKRVTRDNWKNPEYHVIALRALWLAAERALFSCNDRALRIFFSAQRLFWVLSKATSAWVKKKKKNGQSTTIFSITERKTSI